MKTLLYLSSLLLVALQPLRSQADHSDAERLASMSYLEYADRVDCDERADNLTHRICLNLDFQRADSLLNKIWLEVVSEVEEVAVKEEMIAYHQQWILHRRRESNRLSAGARGHYLGIVYLSTMLRITELRIQELSFLRGEEK